MIHLFKSITVAFSIYSRIPMPLFDWDSEDMKYHLCFFPWIGGIIGLVECAWLILAGNMGVNMVPYVLVAMAIPLIITGGFHVDGYMDTSDAMSSWRSREDRLDILKDPHIGAFAVIRLAIYGLLFAAALHELCSSGRVLWLGIFFLARCLSGFTAVTFRNAREDGLLVTESGTASKRVVQWALAIQTVLCCGWMIWTAGLYSLPVIGVALVVTVVYRFYAYSNFGGITGDLAGWFLCQAELWMTMTIWMEGLFLGWK